MSYQHFPTFPSSSPVSPPPSVPPTNSPSSSSQKADQIVHRLFVKLVNVVADARISPFATYAGQSSSPYDTDESPAVSGVTSPTRISSAPGPSSGRIERVQRKESKGDKWVRVFSICYYPTTTFALCDKAQLYGAFII